MESNWLEHEEEAVSDAGQEAELGEFEARQRRMYERGKILVYLIAGVNILFDIITPFLSGEFKPGRSAVHLLLNIALICGFSWARYLNIAGGILSILMVIMALPQLLQLPQVPVGPVLVLVLVTLYCIVSTALLIFSKSIKEYLYQRRRG